MWVHSLNIAFPLSDLCGKEFGDKITLQKHSLVHSTNKPHQCGTCFMSFRHKSSLSRHTKIHLKTTQCHLCHRSFRYESFLKKHLITAHQEEDAINQPHLNTFTKDYRMRYVEQTSTRGEEVSPNEQSEDCVVIAYDDQNPQVIQIDSAAQYQFAPGGVHFS
jgi:KRAB domain-containing zinc finger protein